MANSQAMCTSFKTEILSGIHALGTTVTRGATTADTIKAALYLTTASIGAFHHGLFVHERACRDRQPRRAGRR